MHCCSAAHGLLLLPPHSIVQSSYVSLFSAAILNLKALLRPLLLLYHIIILQNGERNGRQHSLLPRKQHFRSLRSRRHLHPIHHARCLLHSLPPAGSNDSNHLRRRRGQIITAEIRCQGHADFDGGPERIGVRRRLGGGMLVRLCGVFQDAA